MLLFSTAAFAAVPEKGGAMVWIEDQTVAAGDVFYFDIITNDLENIGSLSLSLLYDTTQFEFLTVSAQSMISETIYSTNTKTAGYVGMDFISLDGINGSGELWHVALKAKSTATVGKHTLTLAVGEAYSTSLSPIKVASGNSVVTVNKSYQNSGIIDFYSACSNYSITAGEQSTIEFFSYDMRGLAAADFEIEYDHNLLRLDEVIMGERMTEDQNVIYSINDKHPGYVKINYVSQNGIESDVYPVMSLKFTAIQNVDTSTEILFKPTNIYNSRFDPISAMSFSTSLSLYKSEVAVDLPDVVLGNHEGLDESFFLELVVPGEIALAAADFIFNFDPTIIKAVSVERLDNTHLVFYNIDNENGKISVSFIDEDGVNETSVVLRISFDADGLMGGNTVISFFGKNMVDSDLNPVDADFIGGEVILHKHGSPATCTEDEICGVPGCDKVLTPHLGHDIINNNEQSPTCTAIGWEKYETCLRCDYSTYKELPAIGHSFGEWYETKSPTESEQGEKRRDCVGCDEYETSPVASLKHSHENWEEIILEAVAPTCTETGLTEGKKCSGCGEVVISQEIVPALGHDEEVHEAKSATCTEHGWNAYETCTRCDYTTYEEIPAMGHSHDMIVTEPTCTEQGYTTYICWCGDTYVDNYVNAQGHSFGEWYETKAPTESEQGEKRRDCVGCDEYETSPVASLKHSHEDWEEIILEAVAPTCTETGLTEGKKCSGCGEVVISQEIVPALGHSFKNYTSNNDSTYTEDGTKTSKCDHCDVTDTQIDKGSALGLTQKFKDEMSALSEDASTEATYMELYSVLLTYGALSEEGKADVEAEYNVLLHMINAYNAKAQTANEELADATEIAFAPIVSTGFIFIAALWFLLKKKFFI